MKKIDKEMKMKIAISALAVISFSAVLFSIYVQKSHRLEEVALKEVLTEPSKDVVAKKNEDMFKAISGTRYVCDDEKFVFVNIYEKDNERKADVAVANSNGQYAMAYLREIVGIGRDRKFADGEKMENSLIITDNGNEVKVFINNILIVNNCIKK